MSDEIVASGSHFLAASVLLDREVGTLLSTYIPLRGSRALIDLSPMAALGSLTLAIPLAGWEGLTMSAPGEITGVSNSALTTAQKTLTIARQVIQLQLSDEILTGSLSSTALMERVAMSVVTAYENRFNDMLCALFASVSSNVGTSGSDMTLDDYIDAQQTLMIADNTDETYAMLHGRQIGDLQNSLRGEGGALSFSQATAEMIALKGKGYVGRFLNTDIWLNPRVPTANAGADRKGCMWARGAFGFAEAPHPQQALRGSVNPEFRNPVVVEFERSASSGTNTTVGAAFVGFVELEDARAVAITTDA